MGLKKYSPFCKVTDNTHLIFYKKEMVEIEWFAFLSKNIEKN